MRFVDQAIITVRSGHGGRGCVSFRREKFVPRGGPDGGDGGQGGDVIFRAAEQLITLYDFRVRRMYEAQNGQPGAGAQRYGKAGQDLVVELPVGTLIFEIDEPKPETEPEDEQENEAKRYDVQTPIEIAPPLEEEPEQDAERARTDNWPKGRLVADLDHVGAEVVIARGGRGGKGNTHFKSSTMRAPRFAQPGGPMEEKRLRLELKILADAGVIGLPNAGKSTFISAISAARPKIAPYPFTTLTPNLGAIENDEGERMIVADIPGLIQGAHLGLGLGHRFLRHVERTRFLVHLLSSEDLSLEDPWSGFELVNEELRAFDPELATKPQIEVINKIDLLPQDALRALRERAQAEGRKVRFVSAKHGDGVEELVAAMWKRLKRK
jgi:GTP-binding protein